MYNFSTIDSKLQEPGLPAYTRKPSSASNYMPWHNNERLFRPMLTDHGNYYIINLNRLLEISLEQPQAMR